MTVRSDYRIREVNGTRNAEALLELQRIIFPSDTPADPRRGYWWTVSFGDELVGFACVRDVRGDPTCGYLDRAGVRWAHRGKGLQGRLIRARIRKARKLGWTQVITTTHDNPPSSNNLYRAGFLMYTPKTKWMASGTLYWHRALQ